MSPDLFRRYGSLLKEDGTNQLQRTLPALEEGYIRPDERELPELIEYARKVAEEVRFYNRSGQAVGDWRGLLEPLLADAAAGTALSAAELETAMAARSDWPPHLTLFLVFLELFRHLQDDLNELPRRHLRHYYEQVLALAPKEALADDVHVIFELARNASPTLLVSGTALDAGKDDEKRPLTYETQAETVISAAETSQVRRLVSETDYRGRRRFFVADAIGEEEATSWPTFGRRQLELATDLRTMVEAEIGFAIASPVLLMGEGERSVRILAQLSAPGGGPPAALAIGPYLRAELTGAEGWLEPDSFDARLVDNGSDPMTLEMDLSVGEAAPAIVGFDSTLHGEVAISEWPVLRVLVRGESGIYDHLDGLVFESVDVEVTVAGARDLIVQNEQSLLSPDQPIPLFGSQPAIGSRFYIGSAEIFSKRLASLSLDLEWQDAPEDFGEHYGAYFELATSLGDSSFLTEVHMLYDGSWNHRILFNESLFGSGEGHSRTMATAVGVIDSAFAPGEYRARPGLEVTRFDRTSKHGFVRLTLTDPVFTATETGDVPFEAFGHKAFSRRYATQAVALSRFDPATDPSSPEPALPNEPYTPTLVGLSIGYTASATTSAAARGAADELHVIGPWGHARGDAAFPARLVPELDGEAALFLGIDKLDPPANLSLLFQIDSGTATAAEILAPGETEWSYLAGKEWQPLAPGAVLNDSTFGFQQPGLVVLAVGRDATTEHTAMPAGPVWLRAVIRQPPGSASRTREVHAQAALARFTPATGELAEHEAHLVSGLAAETIKRLRKQNAAIKQVRQPYGSFGGRAAETDADFFRRSSERLRHRNRAVTAWDFEHLVLEAFQEVFKVKCLPHSDAGGNPRAGEAALVIVPDLRTPESTDPLAPVDTALLEPRAGAVLMARIEEFLKRGMSTTFAAVNVIHPVYERLLVEARVAFQPGLDAGYYTSLLDRELQQFLSPWAFEAGEDIVFGARIYRSEVLAFMEGREYVDFVTDFSLYHSYEGPRRGGIGQMTLGLDFVVTPAPRPAIAEMTLGDSFVVGRGVEVAEAARPHAILVSQPAHRITPIEAGEDFCVGVATLGIGYMTIGLDFEIHAE